MAHAHKIVIVGGGLVGSLLAIFLARRGLRVEIREQRADPRAANAEGGRSINLVVTSRGIEALRRVGLDSQVQELTVPVRGRMMHDQEGGLAYQPYGRDESECNYSISRGGLNSFLLDEAARRGVQLHFGMRLTGADFDAGRLEFDCSGPGPTTVTADVIFGADGAGSAVRRELLRLGGYAESVEMLDHGYKELEIPPAEDGSYRIEPHALHIWPRGHFMLMALPNRDGSLTVTLYLPSRGAGSFEALSTPAAIRSFFEKQFPDSLPLIPALERDFLANPTGSLGTVRFHPWHRSGRVALIGDASHAIVPFFGQGMNSGFEDCTALDELLDLHGEDWPALFRAFTAERKPNADAIADMALDNFVEMRDRVGDRAFLLRKQVEHELEKAMPREYRSRYSIVTYSTIPYRVAQEVGRVQQTILDQLCEGLASAEALDLARARSLVRERLTPLLESHGARLDY